jgi:hypothetical protein
MELPPLPEIDGLEIDPERYRTHPHDLRLRRTIVDHLLLWHHCPRAGCRAAAGCRSRIVACFDEQRPWVVEIMIPFLYEGYLDENGEEF